MKWRTVLLGSVVLFTAMSCGGASDDAAPTVPATAEPATSGAPTTPASTVPPSTIARTTAAPTTVAPTTAAPTTLPAPAWREIDVGDLRVDARRDAAIPPVLHSGSGSVLLLAQGADGRPLAATTAHDGETWLAQSDVGGIPVDVDGTWRLYRPARLQDVDSGQVGVTERLEQGPEGTWSVATTDVAGLAIDTRVLPNLRYLQKPLDQLVRLADGAFVGRGAGHYWKSYSTGDQTPWVGRSVDGDTWAVTPIEHAGGDRIFPWALADGPSGPLAAGLFHTTDGTHLAVWTADGGFAPIFDVHTEPPLYGDPTPDLPPEEAFAIDTISSVAGTGGYVFVIGGRYHDGRDLRLLTSADGADWSFSSLDLGEWADPIAIGAVSASGGDELVILATSRPRDEQFGTRPVLITVASSVDVEAPEELTYLEPRSIATSPGGALVVATALDGELRVFIHSNL